MEEAWLAHASQSGAEIDYLTREDVEFVDLFPGEATRDGGFILRAMCQGAEDENDKPICEGRPLRRYRVIADSARAPGQTSPAESFEVTWCPDCAALAEDEYTLEEIR